MHVAEGVLSLPVVFTGATTAVVGVFWGLKKLPAQRLMLAGLLGAVFFLASLIHIPIGVGSAHLIMNGVIGILLGSASFPVIFIALLLQAVLLQFGGLTVLGVNTATMGIGSVLAGYLFHQIIKSSSQKKRTLCIASFIAGFSAVLISGLLTAVALAVSHESFQIVAMTIFLSNLPIMVIEGVVTIFIILYISKTEPRLLYQQRDKSDD